MHEKDESKRWRLSRPLEYLILVAMALALVATGTAYLFKEYGIIGSRDAARQILAKGDGLFDASIKLSEQSLAKRDTSMLMSFRYMKGEGVLRDYAAAKSAEQDAAEHGKDAVAFLQRAASAARTQEQIHKVIAMALREPGLSDNRFLGRCLLKASILGDSQAADRLADEMARPVLKILGDLSKEDSALLLRQSFSRIEAEYDTSPKMATDPKYSSRLPDYHLYLYGLLNVCYAKTHNLKCGACLDEMAKAIPSPQERDAQEFSRKLLSELEAEMK